MRLYINNNQNYISVSISNRKLGNTILSFSTPSIVTCPKNVPCYKGCYAASLEHLRPNLHNSLTNNLESLLHHTEEVKQKLVSFINLLGCYMFRFNVEGDVEIDASRPLLYIELIIEVVRKCKQTEFLVYSKSELWNGLKRLPKNLHIVLSKWGDWTVPNYDNFPTSNILKEGESREGKRICPAQLCKNHEITCETCKICWRLQKGDCIWFIPHGRNKKKV